MNKKTKSEKMFRTIKDFFNNDGVFQFEHCNPAGARWFTVDVDFSHEENECDETQFDIRAYDVPELDELFNDFVKENDFKNINISSVTVIKCAPTHDGLYDDGSDED